jgi:hypothetical protein
MKPYIRSRSLLPTSPDPIPNRVPHAKEITMLRSTTLALLACTMLLATAGCLVERVEASSSIPAATGAVGEALPGQELNAMFEAEKRNATFTELPAQF